MTQLDHQPPLDARVEATETGSDARFVVTNVTGRAKVLYEKVHCARGRTASQQMTARFEESYDTISAFIGAPHRASIALTWNATEAINAVMYALLTEFRDRDNVVTTLLEHKLQLRPVVCDVPGDPAPTRPLIDLRTTLVCCTGASNFTGARTSPRTVRELAGTRGVRIDAGISRRSHGDRLGGLRQVRHRCEAVPTDHLKWIVEGPTT